MLAKVERRVAVKLQSPQRAPVTNLLAVIPGAHHEEHLVVGRVLGFNRLVDRHGPVNILLVPQAVYEHHGNLERLGRQRPIDGLIAPEGVVARMLEDLLPKPDLVEAVTPSELARRARVHVEVIVVEVAAPPLDLRLAARLLVVYVRHHLLPESAVVEPVVAAPAVDHGVHRHGDLQRRMRIDQSH